MISEQFVHGTRRALLDRRTTAGHWEGRLSTSALATATALTALAVAERAGVGVPTDPEVVEKGVQWLVATQNADGGWGDTVDSKSNISTTALGWAALVFGRGEQVDAAVSRAEMWIARAADGVQPERLASALAQRYGADRTFSVPILTMCAITGRLGRSDSGWRLIPQLPFEVAALPRRFFGALRLPVVSYALPALISMGLVRHRRGASVLLFRGLRDRAAPRVLRVLETLQPDGGGFLEAVPLTSFVVMSLVAAGEPVHPVVRDGLDFLRRAARPDGSWPIDSNLATWVTTLSVNALAAGNGFGCLTEAERRAIRDWLVGQQWRVEHPYTGAAPGGWAWTNLPGGVPDADDTSGALIALAHLGREDRDTRDAARLGVGWLLDLQNRDGGIPTFCRGWGTLPFDRSATDLTAHALRAWAAWRPLLDSGLARRMVAAEERAVQFLAANQRRDGAFVPLWFGNQAEEREENPVLGTARVLAGLSARREHVRAREISRRGVAWLLSAQNIDGGWGGGPGVPSTVEETAVALSGLAPYLTAEWHSSEIWEAVRRGTLWVRAAWEARRFDPVPVGLYFARLWYAEDLYPLIFTTGALESIALAERAEWHHHASR